MKPFLFFIMLAFGAQWCVAQDYKCVRYGDTAYFINVDGYLRGMRINGVVAYGGGDTLLMPFETERHVWPAGLDGTNGSWLGSRIMDRHDGFFTFNTICRDTVFVNTQASIGDTWDFYNDTTMRSYKATVTALDTISVLGMLDSAKTIRITSYMGGVIDTLDPVNGYEMVISKEHGFAKTFDLYLFPYRHPSGVMISDLYNNAVGSISKQKMAFVPTKFHVPTQMEVFDFDEGDVFVTHGYTWNEYPERHWLTYDSIVSKTFPDAWHVRYSIFQKEKGSVHYPSWGTPSVTNYYYNAGMHEVEFDTSKLFSMPYMPEEYPSFPRIWHYLPEDSSNCFASAFYGGADRIEFEGMPNYFAYKTGFEQISSGNYTPPWSGDIGYHSSREENLVFSVKNGVPCGTRQEPIRVVETNRQEEQIHIYPNPAKDELHISAGSIIEDVSITDVAGRVLYSAEQLPAESKVDVSGFAPGIYLLRVNGAVRKFVKQ